MSCASSGAIKADPHTNSDTPEISLADRQRHSAINTAVTTRGDSGHGVRFPMHHAAMFHTFMMRRYGSPGGVGGKTCSVLPLNTLGGIQCTYVKASPHFKKFNESLAAWLRRTQQRIPGLTWPDTVCCRRTSLWRAGDFSTSVSDARVVCVTHALTLSSMQAVQDGKFRTPQDVTNFLCDRILPGDHIGGRAKAPSAAKIAQSRNPTVVLYRNIRMQNEKCPGSVLFIRANPFPGDEFRGQHRAVRQLTCAGVCVVLGWRGGGQSQRWALSCHLV